MTRSVPSPRLLLPGLVPREPGLETYWVRPGGVTAVRLAAGDGIDVVDRQGMQPAELTVLGPKRALGVAQDAPATTVRALARSNGDGARAVLAVLAEHGVDPSAATAAPSPPPRPAPAAQPARPESRTPERRTA